MMTVHSRGIPPTPRGGAHRVEIVDHHQERDMAELLDEIHPGEILLEEFMKPMGITARQLAADVDVSPSRISELVNGRRPITADTALRPGLHFRMDARFWMNLQTEYDLRVATRQMKDRIAARIRRSTAFRGAACGIARSSTPVISHPLSLG